MIAGNVEARFPARNGLGRPYQGFPFRTFDIHFQERTGGPLQNAIHRTHGGFDPFVRQSGVASGLGGKGQNAIFFPSACLFQVYRSGQVICKGFELSVVSTVWFQGCDRGKAPLCIGSVSYTHLIDDHQTAARPAAGGCR